MDSKAERPQARKHLSFARALQLARGSVLLLTASHLIACAADPTRVVPPTLTPNRACVAQTVVDERQAAHALGLLLDDWHDAAAKSDEARYFAHLAADSVFLGTDATERWSKEAFQAYAHPHFSAGRGWAMKAARRNIVVEPAGQLAYFDEELETRSLGPARGSGVLVLRDGVWKILQYNLAITVPNERFAQVRDALSLSPASPTSGAASDASRLLSGSWAGTATDGTAIEEHWTGDANGALLGMGRSKGGAFFEYLRLESRSGGKVVYVAQPMGKAPTEFVMKAPGVAGTLEFENLKHDYPKRIRYQEEKDGSLLVSIEGDAKQPKQSWVLKRTLLLPERSKR